MSHSYKPSKDSKRIEYVNAVKKLKVLTPNQKAILTLLLWFANQDGAFHISTNFIINEVGCSDDTLYRARDRFIRDGIISLTNKAQYGIGHYNFSFEKLDEFLTVHQVSKHMSAKCGFNLRKMSDHSYNIININNNVRDVNISKQEQTEPLVDSLIGFVVVPQAQEALVESTANIRTKAPIEARLCRGRNNTLILRDHKDSEFANKEEMAEVIREALQLLNTKEMIRWSNKLGPTVDVLVEELVFHAENNVVTKGMGEMRSINAALQEIQRGSWSQPKSLHRKRLIDTSIREQDVARSYEEPGLNALPAPIVPTTPVSSQQDGVTSMSQQKPSAPSAQQHNTESRINDWHPLSVEQKAYGAKYNQNIQDMLAGLVSGKVSEKSPIIDHNRP